MIVLDVLGLTEQTLYFQQKIQMVFLEVSYASMEESCSVESFPRVLDIEDYKKLTLEELANGIQYGLQPVGRTDVLKTDCRWFRRD